MAEAINSKSQKAGYNFRYWELGEIGQAWAYLQKWTKRSNLEQNYSSTVNFKIYKIKYKTIVDRYQDLKNIHPLKYINSWKTNLVNNKSGQEEKAPNPSNSKALQVLG